MLEILATRIAENILTGTGMMPTSGILTITMSAGVVAVVGKFHS